MSRDDEQIDTLTKLNFTFQQARIYLILSNQYTSSTAEVIASKAHIDRAETYRVLNQLEKKGYVLRKITYPNEFEAVAPKKLLPILLRDKRNEIGGLEKNVKEMFLDRQNSQESSVPIGKFTMVPKVKYVLGRILKEIESLKEKQEAILKAKTEWEKFREEGEEIANERKNALERGVRLIDILDSDFPKGVEEKAFLEIYKPLFPFPNFTLLILPFSLSVELIILDNKVAWIKSSSESFYESSWVVSQDPNVVFLARFYFDEMLRKARKPNLASI